MLLSVSLGPISVPHTDTLFDIFPHPLPHRPPQRLPLRIPIKIAITENFFPTLQPSLRYKEVSAKERDTKHNKQESVFAVSTDILFQLLVETVF